MRCDRLCDRCRGASNFVTPREPHSFRSPRTSPCRLASAFSGAGSRGPGGSATPQAGTSRTCVGSSACQRGSRVYLHERAARKAVHHRPDVALEVGAQTRYIVFYYPCELPPRLWFCRPRRGFFLLWSWPGALPILGSRLQPVLDFRFKPCNGVSGNSSPPGEEAFAFETPACCSGESRDALALGFPDETICHEKTSGDWR